MKLVTTGCATTIFSTALVPVTENTSYEFISVMSYPNPVKDVFILKVNNFSIGKVVIKVTDVSRRTIEKREMQIMNKRQLVNMNPTNKNSGISGVERKLKAF